MSDLGRPRRAQPDLLTSRHLESKVYYVYGFTEVKKWVIKYATVHHDTIGLAVMLSKQTVAATEKALIAGTCNGHI